MRSKKLLALLLALLLLSGCGISGEEVLSVIAPTEAPIAVVESVEEVEEEKELPPEQLACESFSGCFSPFWATADGDLAVVERTQLSLLAEEGHESPSTISSTGLRKRAIRDSTSSFFINPPLSVFFTTPYTHLWAGCQWPGFLLLVVFGSSDHNI